MPNSENYESRNFIQQIVEDDLKNDRTNGRVLTRFPPEPNGFLHIGHAKALAINFGIASDYGGLCNVRFDDTNPVTEDMVYVRAIKHDIDWLGYEWGDREYFASDYFEKLYDLALRLIKDGKAYVDSSSEADIREYRGTVTEPGKNSPYRERSIAENLDMFQRMRAGEFPDGSHVLRAKIDMASNNMILRDPLLYRIKHASHYRRGNEFPIYPMYDFAHPLSDAIEGITHSLCSLEFEVRRALYDWLVDALFDAPRPHQYEFARFNLDYTVMSKRKLLQLVEDGTVTGWDDPRMPTIAGFRRRGVTPEAIRAFASMIGVAKAANRVDIAMLEFAIRDDLNTRAPRIMAVLNPLKIVITNYPDDAVDWIDAPYWPHDIGKEGSRLVPFSREIYIDRDDFQESPEKGFHRLAPGIDVRLRYGYVIHAEEVIKDDNGHVVEVRCSYDPETRGGATPGGKRVKGTVHWVSANEAIRVEVRLYDRLFAVPDPDAVSEGETFKDNLNHDSLHVLSDCLVEPSISEAVVGDRFQFERVGYFVVDQDSEESPHLIFNRTISLRDTWAKSKSTPQNDPSATKSTSSKKGAEEDAEIRTARDPLANLTDDQRSTATQIADTFEIPLADSALISTDIAWVNYLESARELLPSPSLKTALAHWVIQEVRPALTRLDRNPLSLDQHALVRLIELRSNDTISNRIASELFGLIVETGKSTDELIEERQLIQISDEDVLATLADDILVAFPDKVTAYKAGKTGLIGFFVGQLMQKSNGKANPKVARSILEDRLA
jgi:glutaminyl-tRNA synthetase